MNPTVSVIMNTYQEKPIYLKQAIDSYLNQKGVSVQLIVSTIEGDPSLSFMKQNYKKFILEKSSEKKYPHLDLCISTKKEHPGKGIQGIYYQLNKATKYIHGDWFCYCSSNDVAIPTKLQTEVKSCLISGKQVCYSNYIRTNAFLKKLNTVKFYPPKFLTLLKGNYISDCSLIQTSLLKEFLPFTNKYYNCGYWELWLRIYNEKGNVFVHNPSVSFLYRITGQSEHIRRKQNSIKGKMYKKSRIQMRQDILKRYPLYKHAIIQSQTNPQISGVYYLRDYKVPVWFKGNMVLYYKRNDHSWEIVKKRKILAHSLSPNDINLKWNHRITSPEQL